MYRAMSLLMAVVLMAAAAVPRPALSSDATRVASELTRAPRGERQGLWESSLITAARGGSGLGSFMPSPAGVDEEDCKHWMDEINEMREAMESLIDSQVESQMDEAVEKATKGAVKKTNSPIFRRFFKKFWGLLVREAAERGVVAGVVERLGPTGTLSLILTLWEVGDAAGEILMIEDFRAHGMSLDDAENAANAISDTVAHIQIAIQPDLLQIGPTLMHGLELLTEVRPCLASHAPPKPPPVPTRQGRGQRGGGVGPRGGGGTTVTTSGEACWEIGIDVTTGRLSVVPCG